MSYIGKSRSPGLISQARLTIGLGAPLYQTAAGLGMTGRGREAAGQGKGAHLKVAATQARTTASKTLALRGLPELDGIAFGVVEASEAAVGVRLRIDLDGNAGRAKLRDHGVKIRDAKIDHPLLDGVFGRVLVRVAEVCCVLGKRREGRWSGLLLPGRVVVVLRHNVHAEMIAVPLRQGFRLARAKEEAPRFRLLFPRLRMIAPKKWRVTSD